MPRLHVICVAVVLSACGAALPGTLSEVDRGEANHVGIVELLSLEGLNALVLVSQERRSSLRELSEGAWRPLAAPPCQASCWVVQDERVGDVSLYNAHDWRIRSYRDGTWQVYPEAVAAPHDLGWIEDVVRARSGRTYATGRSNDSTQSYDTLRELSSEGWSDVAVVARGDHYAWPYQLLVAPDDSLWGIASGRLARWTGTTFAPVGGAPGGGWLRNVFWRNGVPHSITLGDPAQPLKSPLVVLRQDGTDWTEVSRLESPGVSRMTTPIRMSGSPVAAVTVGDNEIRVVRWDGDAQWSELAVLSRSRPVAVRTLAISDTGFAVAFTEGTTRNPYAPWTWTDVRGYVYVQPWPTDER